MRVFIRQLNKLAFRRCVRKLRKRWLQIQFPIQLEWTHKEVAQKNELATEKVALKWEKKKVQSKVDRIWNFLKNQCAGSSIASLKFNPNEDAGNDDANDEGDDQYDTINLGDGFQSYIFYYVIVVRQ